MAKAKDVVAEVLETVTVELLETSKGINFIYHKSGTTKFEQGVAVVDMETARELEDSGLVKLVS